MCVTLEKLNAPAFRVASRDSVGDPNDRVDGSK